MKVVILSTWDNVGGAAVAAKRLVKALSKLSDIDVHYIVLFKKDKSNLSQSYFGGLWGKWIPWVYFILERLSFYPFEKSKDVRFQFSPARFGVDVLKNKQIREADIVHLHWVNFGYISLQSLTSLLRQKKVVWTFHDMWFFTGGCHYSNNCRNFEKKCGHCPYVKHGGSNDLSHIIWLKKNRILNSEDHGLNIVAPSRWMLSEFTSSSLVNGITAHQIPYAIDTDIFKPGDRKELCTKFSLEENKLYLLFGAVNLKDERKGFQFLKEVFNKGLLDIEFELLIFGNDEDDSDSLSQIPHRRLGYFCSEQELSEVYAVADIFLLPSLMDNLPNTAIESIACGTPVAAFDVGGISDIIEHKKEGYLAHPYNISDLAGGIQFILDKANTTTLSKNCREKALQVFCEQTIANQHIQLYQALINNES